MRIAIIINGISRKKKTFYGSIYPKLKEKFDVEVFETQHAFHGINLSAEAVDKKFDFIIAAGGDGTLNQVINGVLISGQKIIPPIGIIPLGTGNDFARLCNLKQDPSLLITMIERNAPQLTDIGKICCVDEQGKAITRFFINVCSVGMGPATVNRLAKSNRVLGPSLTYLKAILTTFFTHKAEDVFISTADWEWRGKVRVLAIANGKSFGNAIYIAPDAKPDDGIFSTFIAGNVPLPKFLMLLQRLKKKQKSNDKRIIYNTANALHLTAPNVCQLEAEGELVGNLPATIEMLPNKIKFLR